MRKTSLKRATLYQDQLLARSSRMPSQANYICFFEFYVAEPARVTIGAATIQNLLSRLERQIYSQPSWRGGSPNILQLLHKISNLSRISTANGLLQFLVVLPPIATKWPSRYEKGKRRFAIVSCR